ncbi:MAG TPA: PilZ domain-containing protein, partial [Gemmatimonadaceae bacterium]
IEMGDVIRVTFNVAERTVVAIGRVVWATELDPITLEVGLEFIEIDPTALELLEAEAIPPF